MKTKPISPDEVAKLRENFIPEAIFKAFNELIVSRWDGRESSFTQEEVVAVAKKLGHVVNYVNHELDVEDIYRAAGWIVEYNKPGYNEEYPAYFSFKRKKQ